MSGAAFEKTLITSANAMIDHFTHENYLQLIEVLHFIGTMKSCQDFFNLLKMFIATKSLRLESALYAAIFKGNVTSYYSNTFELFYNNMGKFLSKPRWNLIYTYLWGAAMIRQLNHIEEAAASPGSPAAKIVDKWTAEREIATGEKRGTGAGNYDYYSLPCMQLLKETGSASLCRRTNGLQSIITLMAPH